MPMTQPDIRKHYETEWRRISDDASGPEGLRYSERLHDEALYPRYERLIADLNIRVNGGRVLDVGAGSGRWVRYFLQRYRPRRLVGIDFTASSIELLHTWSSPTPDTELLFEVADITADDLSLEGGFDLVNVQNVLFHIPEKPLFERALRNLARLVAADGAIVTTEFMPRATMRTEWMMVRSRYEFEQAARGAGLRIAAVRPCLFLASDVMGLDGPDGVVRSRFQQLWSKIQVILSSNMTEESRRFFLEFFRELDAALVDYCQERIAPVDFPGAKLVVLKRDL